MSKENNLPASVVTDRYCLNGLSLSLNHIATDGLSVCLSRCRAPPGAHDQIVVTVCQLQSCLWGGGRPL
jgi:hypothetical protein